MKTSLSVLSVVLSLVSIPAFACGTEDRPCMIQDCAGSPPGIDTLVIPVKDNVRSFYNDQVNVFNIDHEEPAAQSAALVVMMPSTDDEGYTPHCFEIGNFAHVDIREAKSSYDPAKGLLLMIPYWNYDMAGDQVTHVPGTLKVRFNVQKGTAVEE